jgi:hypothetical protein
LRGLGDGVDENRLFRMTGVAVGVGFGVGLHVGARGDAVGVGVGVTGGRMVVSDGLRYRVVSSNSTSNTSAELGGIPNGLRSPYAN